MGEVCVKLKLISQKIFIPVPFQMSSALQMLMTIQKIRKVHNAIYSNNRHIEHQDDIIARANRLKKKYQEHLDDNNSDLEKFKKRLSVAYADISPEQLEELDPKYKEEILKLLE